MGKVRRVFYGDSCQTHQEVRELTAARDTKQLTTCSSALPDYVFDEGERQPKPPLKRPKTVKVRHSAHIVSRIDLCIL